jgi:transposase
MASRDEWTRRVARWRRSGLTANQFASREGLQLPSLYWWSSTLRRSAQTSPPVVEVVGLGAGGGSEGSTFEVTLPSGVRVSVPAGFATEDFRRLLAVLQAR